MTTLITAAPAITKRVSEYDTITKDYHAYVSIDGGPEEYIGSRPSQGAADRLCDEFAWNYYTDRNTHEVAARIALAMDGGSDDDPFNDGPSQEEQATSAAAWIPCEGGWEQHTPHPFDPGRTVRLFQPRLFGVEPEPGPPVWTATDQAYLNALDGAGPWPTTDRRPTAKVNWSSGPDACAAGDISLVLFELALTDPCALAEFLRGHTAVQRDWLAWRFTGWLRRHHGIVREPAQIAACWTGLLRDTEKSAVEAQRPDAGAAIVRQWTTDRQDFLQVLSQLDEAGICQMAEAAVAFHRKHGSDLTVDQQLAAWQEAAVEAQQCAEAGA